MNFSFSYAKAHGGVTYLRYDDTNPDTTQQIYVKSILEMVEWLGEINNCKFDAKVLHFVLLFSASFVHSLKEEISVTMKLSSLQLWSQQQLHLLNRRHILQQLVKVSL